MALSVEQHDARSKGIGGSDAAAACGLSPWKTPVQLYLEKRGEVKPENLDDVEHIAWGKLLEDVIADEWARRNGVKAHRVNDPKISKQHPFMVANIDRRIVGKREGLEVKNASQWTNENWGELGSDDVPIYYITQGVHYMHVLDYDAWNYAVLLGGNQLLHYRVERDAEIEKQVIAQESRFWECVQTAKAPPPTKVEDLTRLWRKTHGRIAGSPEILEDVATYRELKAKVKPLTEQLEVLKLRIGTFMGEAGDLYDPIDTGLLHATYRAHDETRVESDAVKKRLKPQIVEAIQLAMEIGAKAPHTGSAAHTRAMLEQLGPERFADLIVASMLKTSPVRKFLPK